MNKRKRIIIPIALMVLIGISLISNNELDNARPIDIAQLLALGLLLGVLITNLRIKNKNK